MATNAIDVGDAVRLSVVYRNASTQALIDPTNVILKVAKPNNTSTTYTYSVDVALVKDSTGTYYLDYVPTIDGTHYYKWSGTGNMNAVEESSFAVKTSRVN
jgi:hypothetical protein